MIFAFKCDSEAEVRINGPRTGYIECAPWELDVADQIQAGGNLVHVMPARRITPSDGVCSNRLCYSVSPERCDGFGRKVIAPPHHPFVAGGAIAVRLGGAGGSADFGPRIGQKAKQTAATIRRNATT
jgi:hypothetical protein